MRKSIAFLAFLSFFFLAFSCKDSGNNSEETTPPETAATSEASSPQGNKRAPKKQLTAQDKEVLSSVMYQIMTASQLKRFASYLVTAEMADGLSTQKGPFLIFAPATQAFEALTEAQSKHYSMSQNRAELEEMLKSHIIAEPTSVNLPDAIANKGKVKLKTEAGSVLTANKSGDEIWVSDKSGNRAQVIGGPLQATNGVVYIVDELLKTH